MANKFSGPAIIHIDGDSFFASCEIALNPELKGKPVVTGHERGIASAMSPEAKALGIYRGMPVFQIKKLYPQVVVVASNFQTYGTFAQRMYNIVRRYTDLVSEYSIDECFADITGLDTLYKKSYEEIAESIKNDLKRELGITFSVGLAPTKVLAKIASKWQKPDGLTIIYKEKINGFLKTLGIGNVWGVGPETATLLRSLGVSTAFDLVEKNERWVEIHLSKPFISIWHELRGTQINTITSNEAETQKSIQKTRSFTPATSNKAFLLSQLSKNVEGACSRARDYKLASKRIYYFLKTKEFTYKRFEIPLTNALNTPALIMNEIKNTFDSIYDARNKYRATGITLAELTPIEVAQRDLFGHFWASEKWKSVFRAVDLLDRRFGSQTVILGQSLKALQKNGEKINIQKSLRIPYMGEVR
ncbi:MAG: DNA polymerase IV [Minisyncoccia bacterium]